MSHLDKAFDKKFGDYWTDTITKEEILDFIRQREKELLKEVREKVIGKYEQVTVMTPPDIDELGKDFRNDFKDKQLKKLKELEEGK
ncbi:hypothetical protein LCGC14_2837970 [marine sediment metagenome]|uniref:Uncharacterized protein n=1 Tax=marine sediment metagenome TaxID=412755 RepID=A0A0F8YC21_9ZZZZ